MRRLPIYFLIDSSVSLKGEPIYALNNAIQALQNTLRCDPSAIECISVSIISFDNDTRLLLPLSSIEIIIPEIAHLSPGPTNTGKALSFLIQYIEPQLAKRRCQIYLNQRPLIFLFTAGSPNDMELYNKMCSILFSDEFGIKIACIVNTDNDNSDISWIKLFSDSIVKITSADQESINQFFKWASQLITSILADNGDIFDTTKSLNVIKPKLFNRLMYIS